MKDRLKESLQYAIDNDTREMMHLKVKEFLKAEISPVVDRELLANKDGILKAIIQASAVMGNALAESLIADFKKRISESWTRQKVLDALFGK